MSFFVQQTGHKVQTSQTGGQWYSDTSPLVFPANGLPIPREAPCVIKQLGILFSIISINLFLVFLTEFTNLLIANKSNVGQIP
jgi:hypothetical protein